MVKAENLFKNAPMSLKPGGRFPQSTKAATQSGHGVIIVFLLAICITAMVGSIKQSLCMPTPNISLPYKSQQALVRSTRAGGINKMPKVGKEHVAWISHQAESTMGSDWRGTVSVGC